MARPYWIRRAARHGLRNADVAAVTDAPFVPGEA